MDAVHSSKHLATPQSTPNKYTQTHSSRDHHLFDASSNFDHPKIKLGACVVQHTRKQKDQTPAEKKHNTHTLYPQNPSLSPSFSLKYETPGKPQHTLTHTQTYMYICIHIHTHTGTYFHKAVKNAPKHEMQMYTLCCSAEIESSYSCWTTIVVMTNRPVRRQIDRRRIYSREEQPAPPTHYSEPNTSETAWTREQNNISSFLEKGCLAPWHANQPTNGHLFLKTPSFTIHHTKERGTEHGRREWETHSNGLPPDILDGT